ncbi:hypothetical protein MtrunA17_Chr4g0053151 [Medicago truncatula]|uniref:Uncharacterized protein n=1 Tax=Medicago truncatula TaxID=3880 RepID=A0A396IBH5_MEDTR|nr:hypothetical protein MtrunA17_Chr4g0053151 [Medicago truncatula]
MDTIRDVHRHKHRHAHTLHDYRLDVCLGNAIFRQMSIFKKIINQFHHSNFSKQTLESKLH